MIENKELLAKKEQFSAAIEDALHEIGSPTVEIVSNKLLQDYHCSIPDCLEHPEYFRNILREVFGYADIAVIAVIKKNLGEFSLEKPVGEFLQVLSK